MKLCKINRRFWILSLVFIFLNLVCLAKETEKQIILEFNNQNFKSAEGSSKAKPVQITFAPDRFGNKNSAIRLKGLFSSYLNLGTETLYKSQTLSLSFWANMETFSYLGKGYYINPFIIVKNKIDNDSKDHFYKEAYFIGYDINDKKLKAILSNDSNQLITLVSRDMFKENKWEHIALTFDHDTAKLYLNGKLQDKQAKSFDLQFSETDSIIMGYSANKVYNMCLHGALDDIQILNRIITADEVKTLYEASDPHAFLNWFKKVSKYLIVITILIIIIILLLYFNRIALKRQRGELELRNRISDLELVVVKTQIKPHFISNCMAAIQELVYNDQHEKAIQYIDKFSSFINHVLIYSDKNYITLHEELEMLELIIQFEQLRFKNTFQYDIQIASDLDCTKILIPSLIAQPFVENAIWHGLLRIRDERIPSLTIKVYQKNNIPVIEIEDNGVGRIRDLHEKGNSKGIQLVRDKIKYLNQLNKNQTFGFEIQDLLDANKKPIGTKVIIHLNSKFYEYNN